jgi:hypothetical protein
LCYTNHNSQLQLMTATSAVHVRTQGIHQLPIRTTAVVAAGPSIAAAAAAAEHCAPGSLMRLKKEPRAVNMSVLLNDVTSPMADSAPNQLLCSMNDEAPAAAIYKRSDRRRHLRFT